MTIQQENDMIYQGKYQGSEQINNDRPFDTMSGDMPLEKCSFKYNRTKPDAIYNNKQICTEHQSGQ